MYDDAMQELAYIRERMSNTYELPPMDMIDNVKSFFNKDRRPSMSSTRPHQRTVENVWGGSLLPTQIYDHQPHSKGGC